MSDKEIPVGSIVYFNKRTKKWHQLKKGYKDSKKPFGVKTKDGVMTVGGFTFELGRLVTDIDKDRAIIDISKLPGDEEK